MRTPASPGLRACGEQDVPLEEALSSHRGMTSVLGVSEDLWHLGKNRAIQDREPLSSPPFSEKVHAWEPRPASILQSQVYLKTAKGLDLGPGRWQGRGRVGSAQMGLQSSDLHSNTNRGGGRAELPPLDICDLEPPAVLSEMFCCLDDHQYP